MKKFLSICHRITEGHHLIYWISIVSQLFMIVSQVFSTFLIKVTIDTLRQELYKAQGVELWVISFITGGRGSDYLYANALTILSVTIAVAGVVSGLASLLRMSLRSWVGALINGSMQLIVFDHLERLPYSYYKRNKSGDLIQTCTRDLDVLRKLPYRRRQFHKLDFVDLRFLLLDPDEHLLAAHPRLALPLPAHVHLLVLPH